MILHLNPSVTETRVAEIAAGMNAFSIKKNDTHILITGASMKNVPAEYENEVSESWVFDNDIQLASKKYQSSKREVKIGDVTIGGETNNNIHLCRTGSLTVFHIIILTPFRGNHLSNTTSLTHGLFKCGE